MNTVFLKTYEVPEISRREVLRYAGVRGEAPELEEILDDCINEADGKLTYKVCYREFPVSENDGVLNLGFCETSSEALKKNLCGCESIVLFGATVGIELDRLIAKYSRLSPAKALFLQSLGAERIESLCDLFNSEITLEKAKLGFKTRPRFSPGYGDFPLETQREIFKVLDCAKKIGLTLNESMLMSPTKSVTAIIGVGEGSGE